MGTLQQVQETLGRRIQAVVADPKSSYWLRAAMGDLWERDTQDALADVRTLLELLELKAQMAEKMLEGWSGAASPKGHAALTGGYAGWLDNLMKLLGGRMVKGLFPMVYIAALIAVIVGVDLLFFKGWFWGRLMVNIGIVLVFAAFYLRFLKNP